VIIKLSTIDPRVGSSPESHLFLVAPLILRVLNFFQSAFPIISFIHEPVSEQKIVVIGVIFIIFVIIDTVLKYGHLLQEIRVNVPKIFCIVPSVITNRAN
jgi:hypothetical protein